MSTTKKTCAEVRRLVAAVEAAQLRWDAAPKGSFGVPKEAFELADAT